METSFFEFRENMTATSDASTSEDVDESMRSSEAIDDSMRSDDSFTLLRSMPPSARKLTHTVVDESNHNSEEEDLSFQTNDKNAITRTVPKFSLNGTESTDSSFIGRKKAKRAVILSDSGSDTDDMIPDDDMVMSATTRMSILGVRPKDMGEESDYFDSDEPKSGLSSHSSSLSDLPAVELTQSVCHSRRSRASRGKDSIENRDKQGSRRSSGSTGRKEDDVKTYIKDYDRDSTMTDDVTSLISDDDEWILKKGTKQTSSWSTPDSLPSVDLTMCGNKHSNFDVKKERVSQDFKYKSVKSESGENLNDDDVQLIDQEHDVVALSSDEDDVEMTSSSTPARDSERPDMRKYLAPKSYPNTNVVYVPRHVKINETNKLEGLKAELHKMKYLMETIDMADLPDGGASLRKRLAAVEYNYRTQAERVADMIIEPDMPTAEDIARDGFDNKQPVKKTSTSKGQDAMPSWDDLQAASNHVQPKMFGKQAMSTHMAERSLILERLRDLHESLGSRPPETQLAPAPTALRATLMEHQRHALAWLKWRETQRPRGGILADDMGLGKTLTMISLVVSDKEYSLEREDERDRWTGKENNKLVPGGTLVVCPASLLQQWASEVEKHCASHFLTVCCHHGASRATQPYKLASHDLVVTTYNIVSRDLDKQGVLMRIRWTRVILDEAHIVRNHKALTSRAVSALEAPRRWCLTGTPVQNKELDIFALLKFMKCTPFDDIAMWKKWIDNKSAGGQERLGTVMRTLLLRRTKQQLQESGALTCLPSRDKKEIPVTLNKDEFSVYQKVLLFSKTLLAQYLQQKQGKIDESNGRFLPRTDGTYDKIHRRMIAMHGGRVVKSHEILVLLLRLRQVCCHPGLITAMLDQNADESYEEEPTSGVDLLSELNKLTIEGEDINDASLNETNGRVDQEGTTVAEAIRSVMSPNNPVFSFDKVSSKINAVLECLRKNVLDRPGEKAVVVSQWTSVLSLVERSLREADIACVTLSGAVAVPDRPAIVNDVNNPSSKTRVLLLSLCAGGVGLNLCGANHLLLLDPHWNPQLEEQAQDRIYRVGQKKPVHIYKFITENTVEDNIKRLQEMKLQLADNVLTGARHNNFSKLTIDDLKMLFNMNQ